MCLKSCRALLLLPCAYAILNSSCHPAMCSHWTLNHSKAWSRHHVSATAPSGQTPVELTTVAFPASLQRIVAWRRFQSLIQKWGLWLHQNLSHQNHWKLICTYVPIILMALQAWWIQWLTTWVEANVTMFWPKLASSARMHFLCLQLSGWNCSKTHSVPKQLKVVCLAGWWRKWQRDSTQEAKEAAAAALAFPRWQTPWCAVSSWNLLPKWCDPAQKITEMGSKMVSYSMFFMSKTSDSFNSAHPCPPYHGWCAEQGLSPHQGQSGSLPWSEVSYSTADWCCFRCCCKRI